MGHRWRACAVAGAMALGVAGLGVGAVALWSARTATSTERFQTGTVMFGAEAWSTPDTPQYTLDGSPVQVTMPASEVLAVLDDRTVIWQFRISGHAYGIAGLDFDVSVDEAAPGSVRDLSTTVVYPSAGGDCSAVPAVQPPLVDQTLQAPGTNPDGDEVDQIWCLALVWPTAPDGEYVNTVWATSTASDVAALATWRADIALQPSPLALGDYVNRADAAGKSVTGAPVQDSAWWDATVVADPSGEPAAVVTITPEATNLAPP